MKIKIISYLILLLDVLQREINMENLKSAWRSLAIPESFEEDIADTLLFLWNSACRQSNTGSIHKTDDLINSSKSVHKLAETRFDLSQNDNGIEISSTKDNTEHPDPIKDLEKKTTILNDHTQAGTQPLNDPNLLGRYIYGIVSGGKKYVHFEGIDQAKVYLIWYKDVGILTHQCLPEPYQSQDRLQVENWLKTHQQVLDKATAEFGSLIPMSFDVIIDGSKDKNPDETVRQWLEERYEAITSLMEKIKNKVEYAIKVYSTSEMILEKAKLRNPAIDELNQKIAGMSKGTAHLFKGELNNLIRTTSEEVRNSIADQIVVRIQTVAVEIIEERGNKTEGVDSELIVNLSVLADPDQVNVIGEILEDCQNNFKVTINFTGPWPPYSFVSDID
jgi:hypothetical protein